MFETSTTIHTHLLKFGDHYIMWDHVEEIQLDGPSVLIHMVSGRKITLPFDTYEQAKEFVDQTLNDLGITDVV